MASSGVIQSAGLPSGYEQVVFWGATSLGVSGDDAMSMIIPDCNKRIKSFMEAFGLNHPSLMFGRAELKLYRYRISKLFRQLDNGINRVFVVENTRVNDKPAVEIKGYTPEVLQHPLMSAWLVSNGFEVGARFIVTPLERMDHLQELPRYFSDKATRNERSLSYLNASRRLRADEQCRGAHKRTMRMLDHMSSLSHVGQEKFKQQMKNDFVKCQNTVKSHSQQKLERFLEWYNGPEYKAWVAEKTWKPVYSGEFEWRFFMKSLSKYAGEYEFSKIPVSNMESVLTGITPFLKQYSRDIYVDIDTVDHYSYHLATDKGYITLHDGEYRSPKQYMAIVIYKNGFLIKDTSQAYPIMPAEYKDFCVEYNPFRKVTTPTYQKAILFKHISRVNITFLQQRTMVCITNTGQPKTIPEVLSTLENIVKPAPPLAEKQLADLKAEKARIASVKKTAADGIGELVEMTTYFESKGFKGVRALELAKKFQEQDITLEMLKNPKTISLLGNRDILTLGELVRLTL